MPHANDFLYEWGFTPYLRISDYILIKSTATHQIIRQYHEYLYNITLIFSGGTRYNDLYDSILSMTSGSKKIKGQRNWYSCTIDSPTDIYIDHDQNIIFHLVGHAYH